MTEPQRNESESSISIDEEAHRAIIDYWTPERLKQATPVPLPTLTKAELEELIERSRREREQTESVESVASYDPAIEAPRDTPQEANVHERPFLNGGKLYFRDTGGRDSVGSAQFCGRRNIVLTAAHCVRDHRTGNSVTNVLFKRGYNRGRQEQDVTIRCAHTRPEWHSGSGNPRWEFDYAFLVAWQESGAGWLDMKTPDPYSLWHAIGYPGNYGGTEAMQKTFGGKGRIEGGVIEMLGNPMGPGCSGGAWIAERRASHVGGNFAIGLNSFKYNANPENQWSPLFDDKFFSLYQQAVTRGC